MGTNPDGKEKPMKRLTAALSLILSTFFLNACASGPVVPVPPTVKVAELNSVLITPEVIKFQGKIVIKNRMAGGLEVQKVDWGADLHDNPIFRESFTQLHPMNAHANQTVTFPFQIAMKDVVNQAVDVLAEEAIRVGFRGTVYPEGFEPVPFEASRTIPLPKIPAVSIDGTRGSPLDGMFTVFLRIKNPNEFPMNLKSIDSYLAMNGKRYGLLRTPGAANMGPGGTAKVPLTMKHTRGKGLSMMLNVVQSQSAKFEIGGSFSCQTPYGTVYVPLELSSDTVMTSVGVR
jgi:hypothetical protein